MCSMKWVSSGVGDVVVLMEWWVGLLNSMLWVCSGWNSVARCCISEGSGVVEKDVDMDCVLVGE